MNLDVLEHIYAEVEAAEVLKLYDTNPQMFGFRVAEMLYLKDSGGDRGRFDAMTVGKAFGLTIDVVNTLYEKHYAEADRKLKEAVAAAPVITLESGGDTDIYTAMAMEFGDDFFQVDYFYDADANVEYSLIKGERDSILGKVVTS